MSRSLFSRFAALYLSLLHLIHAYHVSLSKTKWFNASRHCQTYCQSHLVSIHDDAQHTELISQLSRNLYVYSDLWTGLNDIGSPDQWHWTDSTDFDFGNELNPSGHVLRGSYPWASGEPDPSATTTEQCAVIERTTSKWADRSQWSEHHFVCNACHGKLSKYAGIPGEYTYTQALDVCKSLFGTNVASIHNNYEMFEARLQCRETDSVNGCWIGLRNTEWSDRTLFDYGTKSGQYPWFLSLPNLHSTLTSATRNASCTLIKPSNGADPGEYLWYHQHCNVAAGVLCYAPSEICQNANWFVANAADIDEHWVFHTKSTDEICSVSSNALNDQEAHNLILKDKQFYNADEPLTIDMMYRIEEVASDAASSGIVLYLDESDCDSYYYIGITLDRSSSVFLGKFIRNEWTLIRSQALSVAYPLNEYLSLKLILTAGQLWSVHINGELMINSIRDDEFANFGNKYSGHIGIRNVRSRISVHSLFVSGDPVYVADRHLYQTCNDISRSVSNTATPTSTTTSTSTSTSTSSSATTRTWKPTMADLQIVGEIAAPTPRPVVQSAYDGHSASTSPNLVLIIGTPILCISGFVVGLCVYHYVLVARRKKKARECAPAAVVASKSRDIDNEADCIDEGLV